MNTGEVIIPIHLKDLNNSPIPGATLTCTRSIDGGAYSACANTAVEVGGGDYKLTLTAAERGTDYTRVKATDGTYATMLTVTTDAEIQAAVQAAIATVVAGIDALPTAAQNADAVWDEAVADHVTPGTFGRFLQRVYRYFFNKTLHTNTSMVVYADDGTTSDAVMAVSGDTSSVTKGAAS